MANFDRWFCFTSLVATLLLTGCQPLFPQDSKLNSLPSNRLSSRNRITTVDVAIAKRENSADPKYYIGTTEPQSTTILRSQLEGNLLDLSVAVGDRIAKNEVVGRLDDSLLAASLAQARAELASLESEVAKENLNVKNAEISLQEAKIRLEQAENDAQRYVGLAKIGAISQQQAESFQTAARVAKKAVLLREEEVKIAQQTVTTARGRIAVQQAAIAEIAQRQTYSQLIAPATGIVVSKNQEPGNLIRPGEDILSIGDFSAVKILVPISATDLNLVSLEQRVEIKFDAFSNKVFQGKVTKIAPSADVNTRKIAIEITVINNNNEIKSGLLAKVQLSKSELEQIVIPQSAITEEAGVNYIFVVENEDFKQRQATVTKRPVTVNNFSPNQVTIEKGLQPGEKYIIRSSQPLTDNEVVNLSILSK